MRIDGEPLHQRVSGRSGRPLQRGEAWPRRLGIDVIGGDRRDPAPVVDAGCRQPRKTLEAQIRRHLDVHCRAQHEPRGRGRPQHVVERGLGGAGHAGPGLGAEILDDDFLQMAVAGMQVAQHEQREDAFAPGLADADQDAAGERHTLAAGRFDHRNADRRVLVGGAEMRPARLGEPGRGVFQHDALRDAHAPQRRDLRFSGNSGIDVRQQPGLAGHELAHGDEIFDGAGVAEPAERGTRRLVAQLGLVAEREQSLAASGLASRPRDRQHLVGAQVGGARLPRFEFPRPAGALTLGACVLTVILEKMRRAVCAAIPRAAITEWRNEDRALVRRP